jgi:hypothetical protein
MESKHEIQNAQIREAVVRQLEQYSVEVLEAVLSILEQQESQRQQS